MFQTTIVEKVKTHFTFSKFFKPCICWDNVEEYGTAGEVTDDMRIACWIPKGTDTYFLSYSIEQSPSW